MMLFSSAFATTPSLYKSKYSKYTFGVSEKISKMIHEELSSVDAILQDVDAMVGLDSDAGHTPWAFSRFRYRVGAFFTMKIPRIASFKIQSHLEFYFTKK